jgi:fatty acid synthase subunit beta
MGAVEQLLAAYPTARSSILCEEDLDYFLHLCQTGGKPVNFIPVIDGSLSIWFKKDSLWYSEDLAGVPEMDAQRVVILQGPVAVRHTSRANEPVATILDDFIAAVQGVVPANVCEVGVLGRELGGILPGSSDTSL